MKNTPKFVILLCQAIPTMLMFISISLSFSYIQSNSINLILPMWDIIFIYFWLIYRPEILSILAIFILSIFQDILSNGVIGLSALINILISRFILSKYSIFFLRDFVFLYILFIFCSLASIFSKWVFLNFIFEQHANLVIVMMQWLITISIYPIVHYILQRIDNFISGFVEHVSTRE